MTSGLPIGKIDAGCVFMKDCHYYDQDGVVCNEEDNPVICPEYQKFLVSGVNLKSIKMQTKR